MRHMRSDLDRGFPQVALCGKWLTAAAPASDPGCLECAKAYFRLMAEVNPGNPHWTTGGANA